MKFGLRICFCVFESCCGIRHLPGKTLIPQNVMRTRSKYKLDFANSEREFVLTTPTNHSRRRYYVHLPKYLLVGGGKLE